MNIFIKHFYFLHNIFTLSVSENKIKGSLFANAPFFEFFLQFNGIQHLLQNASVWPGSTHVSVDRRVLFLYLLNRHLPIKGERILPDYMKTSLITERDRPVTLGCVQNKAELWGILTPVLPFVCSLLNKSGYFVMPALAHVILRLSCLSSEFSKTVQLQYPGDTL